MRKGYFGGSFGVVCVRVSLCDLSYAILSVGSENSVAIRGSAQREKFLFFIIDHHKSEGDKQGS